MIMRMIMITFRNNNDNENDNDNANNIDNKQYPITLIMRSQSEF